MKLKTHRFEYLAGGGPYYWNVCAVEEGRFRLYLSTKKLEDDGCFADVTILATFINVGQSS